MITSLAAPLVAYFPSIEPMPAAHRWWWLLIVPLAIGISMSWKAVRLATLEKRVHALPKIFRSGQLHDDPALLFEIFVEGLLPTFTQAPLGFGISLGGALRNFPRAADGDFLERRRGKNLGHDSPFLGALGIQDPPRQIENQGSFSPHDAREKIPAPSIGDLPDLPMH